MTCFIMSLAFGQATQAQFGEFPWMTAVLQTEFVGSEEVNLYVCGGSLIFPDVVLTAAHCVQSWTTTPSVLKVLKFVCTNT